MKRLAPESDVVIVEIGGTVGDIESLPFLEAIRQFRHEIGRENAIFIHLTLVPFIAAAGEVKTKPTQHSVRELMEIGIQPDILICRTERALSEEVKRKIALFCNVEFGAVIESRDVPTIYQIPLLFHEQGLDERVMHRLGLLGKRAPDLSKWRNMVERVLRPHGRVKIAVIGKYTGSSTATRAFRRRSSTAESPTTSASMSPGLPATCSPAGKRPASFSPIFTASSFRADSECVVSKGCSRRSATLVSPGCHSSESAWECRPPSSSSRAT